MSAKSLELRHTISHIRELDAKIEKIEAEVCSILETLQSSITTIPGMGIHMGAMILAEIGDFSRFDSPDKILAYSGLSPSTYQSGQLSLNGTYSHMDKCGFRYLHYALYNATKYVCLWEPSFAAYLSKKRAEGKHYNVAISHAAKKTGSTYFRYGEVWCSFPYISLIIFSILIFCVPQDALFVVPFFTFSPIQNFQFWVLTFYS